MNSPTRILYLIDELDLGGTEQQLLELLKGLDRSRYAPSVACFRDHGRLAREIEALGVPVALIPKQGAIDPVFFARLVWFIALTRPRIVQTFLFTANTWGRLAAWLCGVPIRIACERNVDTWKGPVHRWVDRVLARGTTCFVTNAATIKQFLTEEEGVTLRDIRIIYNGVRAERFETMPSVARPAGTHIIGIIGRLEPQKDHRTCLAAFAQVHARMPSVRLRVIGDGSLHATLELEAKRLGIAEQVEFCGATRDMAAALSGLDLLVVSSTREGCANVILEAMVAAVPVVATAVGGNPELLEQGVSGLLVPPAQPEALAGAIHRVLDDRPFAQALTHHACERVAQRFSVEGMVHAYERLYHELLVPPLRVCYVIDDLGAGGAQRQLVTLVSRLPRERIQSHVISLSVEKIQLLDALKAAGVPVTTIAQRGKWSWSCFWRLYGTLRRLRPQIVHTWLFTADLYGRLAARLVGVPVVMSSVRSIDLDKPRHYVWADRWLSYITDVITINAQAERRLLITRERVLEGRIQTIYNGVDTDAFDPSNRDGLVRRRWSTPSEALVIAFIGRLSPEKNPTLFFEGAAKIASRIPEAHFWVVGDGPQRPSVVMAGASPAMMNRARMLGYQPEMADVLAAIDVVVVPSDYEGCANVILEAMAQGKPVIATRVGGNPELVLDGRTGVLVNPGSAQELADAMERLACDRDLAVRMGRAGRERAVLEFSLPTMVDRYVQLYETYVVNGNRRSNR